MTIQDQLGWEQVNDENLSFFKAIGVDYLTVNPPPDMSDGQDRTEFWQNMRQLVEKHGLKLQNVGMNELAERHFQRAIQLDPGYQVRSK